MTSDTRSTTLDQLRGAVEATQDLVHTLDQLAYGNLPADLDPALIEVLTDHGIDLDDADPVDLFDELLDTAALEIYGSARVDHHGITLTGVVVVTGTGGPHLEFEVSEHGSAEVRGYWGTDQVTRRVSNVGDLAERLAENIGGWEQDR